MLSDVVSTRLSESDAERVRALVQLEERSQSAVVRRLVQVGLHAERLLASPAVERDRTGRGLAD